MIIPINMVYTVSNTKQHKTPRKTCNENKIYTLYICNGMNEQHDRAQSSYPVLWSSVVKAITSPENNGMYGT